MLGLGKKSVDEQVATKAKTKEEVAAENANAAASGEVERAPEATGKKSKKEKEPVAETPPPALKHSL